MFRGLLGTLYKLAGWKTVGDIPRHLPKAIWVVAPHASWKDFLLGIGVRAYIKIDIMYLGKAELFKPPFGWIFYALNGQPVNRSERTHLVDTVADLFHSKERLHIALAPEGTRKNVSELKTGFYYIALKANIPLVLVGFDYPRKVVEFSKPFYLSGDFEQDKVVIAQFFNTIQGEKKDWLKRYLINQKNPS